MNLKEYVIKECPKRCGVNPAFGEAARLIYVSEMEGNKAFSPRRFETIRDRATIALPFFPLDHDAYFNCLDVIELCCLYHRQIIHKEDHGQRINALEKKREYDDIELSVIASEREPDKAASYSVWNG